WSADGRRLLVAGPRGGLIHDLARGRSTPLRLTPGRRLLAAAWSPRGAALALATAGGGRAEIRLRGRRGPLFSAGGRLTSLVWSPDGRWLAADWPTAREWLLVRVLGRPRVEAVTRYGGRLRPQEWCCVG
ncbi:MAG TPA: hypothetical protein VH418_19560, partial [Solirubrobacteraceae bacterium]